MLNHWKVSQVLLVGALTVGACGAQEQGQTGSRERANAAAAKARSEQAAPAVTLDKDKEKEKEKRGNTPPGMDRAGGGPMSGAIVDPAGVIKK